MKPPEKSPVDKHGNKTGDRIAKLLARAGVASRREIERMIEERRIALDGVPLETPATILTSLKGITVDGNPVAPPETARLFRYHKPTGLLVAERDPKGRPTIYDKLPGELPRVVPVGRLDLNTEGLLLLTNDGELKRQLELPSSGIPRTYRARCYGHVSQAQLEDLIEGIEIEGVRYGSIDANMERRTGTNFWIEMKLAEGKNREVRRVLEHLGLQVSRLIRTAYGPFPLHDMPVGAVDEIKQNIVVDFMKNMKGMKMVGINDDATLAVGGRGRRNDAPRSRPAPTPRPIAAPPRAAPARAPIIRSEASRIFTQKPVEAPGDKRRARSSNFGPKVEREAAVKAAVRERDAAAKPAVKKHWRNAPTVPGVAPSAPVTRFSPSGKPGGKPGGSRPSSGPRKPRPGPTRNITGTPPRGGKNK
ncbi:rRNA pseudouridine synthase [Sphingomonas paeninsulae]|uniref:Pseudouridine synthase n=1 Tax=Sphingomonas paeninsulae TaxID=2319844 RepID=A0A494TP43_SPHPE|nr:pseudouridine synthase [Sphingomonas paeninsulae]AYJ87586.1 rRNA pseudouridine synthase [Sphingomonas paeninsulae]